MQARCINARIVGVVAALLVAVDVAGLILRLTPADMRRALTLARWPTTDAERARFHDRYLTAVNSPVFEYFSVQKIEVITELRRLELIAEEHARINDTFGRGGMRDVEDAIAPWRGKLTIVISLAYDPTKYITGVPAVDVVLEGRTLVAPLESTRRGVYSSGPRPVLIGGTVEATFDAESIGQEARPVFIHREGKLVARPVIDFAKLE